MNKIIKEYAVVTLGTFLVSAAIFFFMIPSQIAVGSISGLSVMLARITSIPVSAYMLLFNAVLLVIGFALLGREFGAKTVYSSALAPMFQFMFEKGFPNLQSLSGDVVVDALCYLLIVAVGQALLFRINASSGGMDIIAKILNKYVHLELGTAMTLGGMCVAVSGFLVYDTPCVIVGILATYGNGIILDNFINGFNRRKRVCILSDKYEQIQEFITNKLNRGVTLYQAVGGFKKSEKIEIVTILARNEYAILMNYLSEVDDHAFVTVSTVNEVVGNWSRNRRRIK